MKAILFDLDGTLVDSSQGVLNGFKHTLSQLNKEIPPIEQLKTFIGPPLEVTFFNIFQDANLSKQALDTYREFYKSKGIHQAVLYPNIEKVLQELCQSDYQLFVTTSKIENMAKFMLRSLKIDNYFTEIYGSTDTLFHKKDIIQTCLTENHLNTSECVIVGNTKYDMIGGQTISIHCLGITWGFGLEEDLIVNGAEAVCHSPIEIPKILKTL